MPYRTPAVDEEAVRDAAEVSAFSRDFRRSRTRNRVSAMVLVVAGFVAGHAMLTGTYLAGHHRPPTRGNEQRVP